MKIEKYKDDYRVHTHVDVKGRIVEEAEYIGRSFRFKADPHKRRTQACLMVILNGISMAILLAGLACGASLEKVAYAVIPHTASLIPLWFTIRGLAILAADKNVLTREQKDRMSHYFVAGSWSALAALLLAILGSLVYLLFVSPDSPGRMEWFFLLSEIVSLGSAAYTLSRRKLADVVCIQE